MDFLGPKTCFRPRQHMLFQIWRNYGFDYAVLPGEGRGGGMAKEEEEEGGGEEEELPHRCVFCLEK